MMDPWAHAAMLMAAGPGGFDAEYRIRGSGPAVRLRVVLEREDKDRDGRVQTASAALVPADANQLGRPERGDTLTIGTTVYRVENVMAGQRGWMWRLPLSLVR